MSNFQMIPVDLASVGFGPQFAGRKAPGFVDAKSPNLVPIDPGYRFDNPDALRLMNYAWSREWQRADEDPRKGVYFFGPTGSGKTTLPEQYFARLGVPVMRITWSPKMEAAELISGKTVMGGDLLTVDQAITLAARQGIPVLFNEIDVPDPGELMPLNDVIEKGLITLPDGTQFTAKRGFMVFATANTAGMVDEIGIYNGTRPLNAATTRRFFSMELGYPDEAAEEAFLTAKVPSLGANTIKGIAKCVSMIRKAHLGTLDGKRLSVPISRPETLEWARAIPVFKGLSQQGINVYSYTLGFCFFNRLLAEDKETCEEIIQQVFTGVSP